MEKFELLKIIVRLFNLLNIHQPGFMKLEWMIGDLLHLILIELIVGHKTNNGQEGIELRHMGAN